MFILWSFARNVCQFPTGLQLVVHLTNPQTTVEELSNAVSSSPNSGLVIRKEISDFLLGLGHSGAVPGRGPWQPAWNSWSVHPWGVEGISECSSVSVRGVCKASARHGSASSVTPGPCGRALPVRDFSGIASQVVPFALVGAGLVRRQTDVCLQWLGPNSDAR